MDTNQTVKIHLLNIATATHEPAHLRLSAVELLGRMGCEDRSLFRDNEMRQIRDACMGILRAEHEDTDERVRAAKFVLEIGWKDVTVEQIKALPKAELDTIEQRLQALAGGKDG
jgi:hypothetical protein